MPNIILPTSITITDDALERDLTPMHDAAHHHVPPGATMRHHLLTVLPFTALLAMVQPAVAADDICQPQLAEELKAQGVEWSTLQDQEWVVETQQTKDGYEKTSGYQFFARPESCTKGKLVARMDQDCRITQIFTRRGCHAGSVRAK